MILITPLKNTDVEGLKIGDIVYLSGVVCTGRDKAHKKALSEQKFPFNLDGGVLFHAGPTVKREGGKYEVVSVGPTTSSRMNALEPEFIRRFSVKAVIGKGGMGRETVEAMKENKCVYLALTGGCAAATAKQIKKVVDVRWLELGVPEAVWLLEVERLGPLIVGIDCYGNNLYEEVEKNVLNNFMELKNKLK